MIASGEYGLMQAKQDPSAMAGIGSYVRPTVRQQLVEHKLALETKLENINAAIAALDGNPGAEQVMDAIGRAL